MKNYEEMARDVLQRIENYESERRIKRARMTKVAASVTPVCAVAVVGVGLWKGGAFNPNHDQLISSTKESTASDLILSADNVTSADRHSDNSQNSTKDNFKTERLTQSTEKESTSNEKNTLAQTENDIMETTDREPIDSNTGLSEQQPKESGSEAVIIPRWDERTLPTQFMEFDLNGISYCTKDHNIEGNHIGGILGTVTMEGQDVYEDKIHSIVAEVFNINDISNNCAVAVKFNGYESYYVYTNRSYSPATLSELVDDLKLSDTIFFGILTPDDRTFVTDYDKSTIKELLNEYRDCATQYDYVGHRKLFSISTNVDLLGITNKSFAVTEDGYITTNIMEQGYAFYIGADKAQAIADKLGIDKIERVTPEPVPGVFVEE